MLPEEVWTLTEEVQLARDRGDGPRIFGSAWGELSRDLLVITMQGDSIWGEGQEAR